MYKRNMIEVIHQVVRSCEDVKFDRNGCFLVLKAKCKNEMSGFS